MPVPSTKRALLTIPMRTGLSQKQDARYLEPGALLTAVNVIKPKSGVLHKRPGSTPLPVTAVPSRSDGSVTPAACNIQTGKRLGRFQGAHVVIGADYWTDAVYPFNEASQRYTMADRVPEVLIGAPIPVMSFDTVVSEVDSAVCNGYQVHVCLASPLTAGTTVTNPIWFCVTDAETDEIVVPQQMLLGAYAKAFALAPGTQLYAPKLIVCGTTVVLSWLSPAISPLSGNNPYGIYAMSLDMTQPWVGWQGTGTVPVLLLNCAQSGTPNQIGAYDICAAVADATEFALVAQQYNGATYSLTLNRFTVSTLTLAATANVTANATSYAADGATDIVQGWAVRADATNNETAIAYTWLHGGVLRVGVLMQQWPAVAASVATDVNVLTVTGPLVPAALSCPFVIGLERIGTVQAFLSYTLVFSSYNGDWTGLPPPNLATVFANGTSTAYVARYVVSNNAGTMALRNGSPHVMYGAKLASHVQVQNNVAYWVGYLPSYEQGSYFLFADDAWADVGSGGSFPPPGGAYPATTYQPARLVGTIGPRLAAPQFLFGTAPHTLPHISLNTSPPHASPSAYQVTLPVSFSPTTASPTVYRLDFASDQNYQNAELGQNMAIATGCPSAFDGARCFEMGFPYYPHINTISDHGSGSGLGTGLYSYIATYEWRDARGQLHKSARGLVAQKTTGNAHYLEVVVPCMCFTAREKNWAATYQGVTLANGGGPQGYFPYGSNVIVKLYRTAVAGITYYDLDDGTMTQANNLVTYAINQQGLATVTIIDKCTDAQLVTHAQLYGDGSDGTQPGNILDEFCPPAFQGLITHKNRLFGIDGPRIWYTKAFTDGVAPGWSELMAFSVDDGPGNVLAIASQDDNLVVFKRDRLFVVVGDGPTDNGGQNNLQAPARVSSDAGCNDWRSVVTTAEGTYFLSDQGRRLFTRDGQVVPVVTTEDLDSANQTPTSAVEHPTLSRIVFTECPGPTWGASTGISIYRDYVLDSWTQGALFTNPDGGQPPIISAVVAGAGAAGQAVYHSLRSTGIVDRESATTWEAGASVYQTIDVQTPWIKAEGIEGFAIFRRFMLTWSGSDAHALTVSAAYDYSGTWYSLGTITSTQMVAMTTPLYQYRFGLPRHRAESVRFRIQDASDVDRPHHTGEGPTLISMALEVAVYTNQRLFRLPASQVT